MNPLHGDDFAQLLARVRQGDETAAGELVQRYERAVLRSVRNRLSRTMRGALDSMDVMQSVHRSLLVGLKNERFQMTTPEQLIGLAVVMVQRKVARHWRKLKRSPGIGNSEQREAAPPLDRIAGNDSAPSEVVAANELLEQFLAELDELDRRLVKLKLDGFNTVDTAAKLNLDPAFVRMRWSRLRQTLRGRGLGTTEDTNDAKGKKE